MNSKALLERMLREAIPGITDAAVADILEQAQKTDLHTAAANVLGVPRETIKAVIFGRTYMSAGPRPFKAQFDQPKEEE